jgi:hypothetical protein
MVDAIEISGAFIGQIRSAVLEWTIHRLFLPTKYHSPPFDLHSHYQVDRNKLHALLCGIITKDNPLLTSRSYYRPDVAVVHSQLCITNITVGT